ncbi:hypothetical protein BNJ_00253 [Kaumoebavirus]|uniref:hypothetical protein n=1 Tax=Kaumoebavirus TaxID=1859492 RepID=UPI0009C2A656|nr:hypothetical protein BNJ_00253 [Kaumoebavirus]ARA72079.1 hypothetical protein BNJ_00253 [Kaumoebavirus]
MSKTNQRVSLIPTASIVSGTEKFLKELLDDTKCGDVLIKCKDGERMVDSNILKKRSEYFAAMFASNMREAQARVVDLGHVNMAALNIVLNQMYIGKLPAIISFPQLIDAYCLCHEWNMVGFLEHYHVEQKNWPAPHHLLKYSLERYPVTAELCFRITIRITDLISNRISTLTTPNVLDHTDNLTRQIITYVALNQTYTAKNITDIIDTYRKKKRKIVDVDEPTEQGNEKKSKNS